MTIKLRDYIEKSTTDIKRYNRKERRANAKFHGVKFTPQYNGKAPITFAEYVDGFHHKETMPNRIRKSPLNKAVSE